MNAMQSLPVSAAPDYRAYSYDATAPMVAGNPYTQANASNMSLPTSEPSYNYSTYIQQ